MRLDLVSAVTKAIAEESGLGTVMALDSQPGTLMPLESALSLEQRNL